MANDKTNEIIKLREKGLGYKAIAVRVGMTRDAVRSLCKRRGLDGVGEAAKLNYGERRDTMCFYCGLPLVQPAGRGRRKRFCSDKCRKAWWVRNPICMKPGPQTVTKRCAGCGEFFMSFASQNKKYCSLECYKKTRYGGNENDRTDRAESDG